MEAWSSRFWNGAVSIQSPGSIFSLSSVQQSFSVCSEALSARRRMLAEWGLLVAVSVCEVTPHAPKVFSVFIFKGCFFHFFFILLEASASGPFAGEVEEDRGRSKSLRDPSAHGDDSVPSHATSRCLNLSAEISGADRFSESSQSATRKSPDNPLLRT